MQDKVVRRKPVSGTVTAYDEQFAWTQKQVDLIKNTCAKDATDDELQLFLHFCKESGVDPLRKQAHFVATRYKNKQGQWVRTTQMIVGIDGFRKRAEEQNDFLGIQSAAVYSNDDIIIDFGEGTVSHKVNPLSRKSKDVAGAWATVHRKGRKPYVQWIDWAEYAQNWSPMHKEKPAVMCTKTAEATALRHEYPDKFSGMYAPEEMPEQYQVDDLMGDGDEAPPQRDRNEEIGAATPGQADLLKNFCRSPLMTEEERARVHQQLNDGLNKRQASELIDRIKAKLDGRRNKSEPVGVEQDPVGSGSDNIVDAALPPVEVTYPEMENKGPSFNELFPGQWDATQDIPFDELEGTPPQPEDDPGMDMDKQEPEPEKPKRTAQHLRVAFSSILGGVNTALDCKFTPEQASELLARIMHHLGIDHKQYLSDQDGLIHTKPMESNPAGQRHLETIINFFQEPGALHRCKAVAKDVLAPKPEGEPEENPKAALENTRKAIVDLQTCIGREYGPDGIKLAATILQKNNLGRAGQYTKENLDSALAGLTKTYTDLCSGVDVKELLQQYV